MMRGFIRDLLLLKVGTVQKIKIKVEPESKALDFIVHLRS